MQDVDRKQQANANDSGGPYRWTHKQLGKRRDPEQMLLHQDLHLFRPETQLCSRESPRGWEPVRPLRRL